MQNCKWAFEIQCPKIWTNLRETNRDDVRFCETCMRDVYFVKSDEEAQQAAKDGRCIAIDLYDPGKCTLGMLVPDSEE